MLSDMTAPATSLSPGKSPGWTDSIQPSSRQDRRKVADFSFREHAPHFDAHIGASIPSYDRLLKQCVMLSHRFVQNGTRVVDIGCSTGALISSVRDAVRDCRRDVEHVGIDVETGFKVHWRRHRAKDLRFFDRDARDYRFENVSLATSLFTIQFLPERHKVPTLQRIFDGLVDGGALIIAEKVLASTSRLQDCLTFPYYDYKLDQFSEKQILDKERQLRGKMTSWTRSELEANLTRVGFFEMEHIWCSFPFVAILAIKHPY